jgi:hypothetical protein
MKQLPYDDWKEAAIEALQEHRFEVRTMQMLMMRCAAMISCCQGVEAESGVRKAQRSVGNVSQVVGHEVTISPAWCHKNITFNTK